VITGTIAVCTRNRATLVGQCLASLENQLAEPGQIEVLVVDNGSNDATPELLQQWQGAGEGRRVVQEPEPGLSRARNAALEAATRDVVLFLDDDALAPPHWAAVHLEAYEERERTGSTGGPVGLEWPAGRPEWLTDSLLIWYSALDLGDETGPFPTSHGPYGTNMSVNRRAALDVGGYDPALGRWGRRLLSGEEPDLTRRLREAGWEIVYAAGAGIVHQVSPDRLSHRWVLRRGWWQGRSNSRLELLAGQWPSRVSRLRGGWAELGDTRERWARWREVRGEPESVAVLVQVLAHGAAGLELLRAAVDGRGASGGGHRG
jgi:glycosyltransferase involved in cell wall biosynthesis